MKNYLNILGFFFIFLIVFGSCNKDKISADQASTFIKLFGGKGSNQGFDVKQLNDEGYILLGSIFTTDSMKNICLIRTDKYGNEIWRRSYGGNFDDEGMSLQRLNNGGYIIVGNITTDNSTTNLKRNIFLAKVKENGDTVWTKKYGGDTSITTANYVNVLSKGGFIIAGSIKVAGSTTSLLLITDGNGNNPKFLKFENSEAKCVQELSDGYLFVGTSQYELAVRGASDLFVARIDTDGNYRGVGYFGGDGADSGEDLKLLPDSTFICTGTFSTSNSETRPFLLKLKYDKENHSIASIWSKTYDFGNYDISSGVEISSSNGFVLTGTYGRPDGNEDILFIRTDADGNLLNSNKYGETGNQTGKRLIRTPDGGFVIVGSNEISGNSVITLMKVRSDGGI